MQLAYVITSAVLEIRIGRPFIESRNISLDSSLEIYSKCVLQILKLVGKWPTVIQALQVA